MSGLESTLHRAARRHLAQRMLVRGGRGLAVASGIALALLLVDRGLGLGFIPGVYGILPAMGLLAGVAVAFLGTGERFPLAVRLDRTFGLHDRLATAHAIGHGDTGRTDAAFAALVQRDAEAVAGRLDVAHATPVRFTPVWFVAVTLAVVLGLGTFLVPEGPWRAAAATPTADSEELAEERAAVVDSIEEAVAQLEEDAVLDEAGREDVDALRALADQLGAGADDAAGDLDAASGAQVDKARDESAARLEELAERLADEAERDARATDELAQRFRDLESAQAEARDEAPMRTDELIDALRRGEFGEAGDLLDELTAEAESLDEAERRRAAEALRDASRRIEEMAEALRDADPEQRRRLQEILEEQGLDQEAIDELLGDAAPPDGAQAPDATPPSGTTPDPPPDIDDTLRRENVDEEVARDLSREIESYREEEAFEDRVQEDTRRIADALDEAADRVEQPESPDQPPVDEQDQESPGSEQESPQEQPGGEQKTPQEQPGGEQKTPKEQPGGEQKTPKEQPGGEQKTPKEQPGGEQKTPKEQPGGEQKTPKERPGGEQKTPKEQPGGEQKTPKEQPGGEQKMPQEQPGGEQKMPQEQPGGEQKTPREQPGGEQKTPHEQPGGEQKMPQEQPDGEQRVTKPDPNAAQQPDAREQPSPGTETANERPGDTLREIERRRRDATRNRNAAERARDTARRLAENMSDEERRQWAERWQQETGQDRTGRRSGETPPNPLGGTERGDDIALTDDDAQGRKVADWLGDELPGTLEGATPIETAGRLRSARRAAERAVNESSVPPRYHRLIKRYFDRLEKSAPTVPEDAGAPAGNTGAGGGDSNP